MEKNNKNNKNKLFSMLMNMLNLEKNEIKSQKGVSIISLVITILLIIILAAIVIINGFTKNINEANFAKMYNEFIEVENAISQRGYENKLDSDIYPFIGKESYSKDNSITINNVTYEDGYYLLTPTELETLGVTSVEREYVANYHTGDVVLLNPYFWADKKVFRKEDLLESYTNNSLVTKGEYDEIKGVNKPIILDGMLPVKHDGSGWIVVDIDDPEWYDYSIGASGGPVRYANVMLLDDTILSDINGNVIPNDKVRGMNIDNLVGMRVENEGSTFIWIPRFTYKDVDGNRSIVYSNLTKDYTGNGFVRSPAFYYGEYTGAESTDKENTGYVAGGKELTGIWVSKYQAGYVE